ncbi:MAG TPA: class I SAM-dependent methyltransferase [Chloroflexota bacterium]|jgi:SAM-dependent methyltransferase|nr:class I SAM-dependent methyltransferase [Chloroflexota bacterium]
MEPAQQGEALELNRQGWDVVAPRFYGGTALPGYGPLAPTEDSLRLLPELRGARVLELGCGSGHSLAYCAERGAAELWGLDLSQTQLDLAATLLRERGHTARLVQSPMERDPGLPAGHFDLVLSIYALGWTTDLGATLALVARALRPGAHLVFSWEHPFYGCLAYEDGRVVLARSYCEEGPVRHEGFAGSSVPVVLQRRKLSTYLNALTAAGLVLERLIEGEATPARARPQDLDPEKWYSLPRARLMPTTFVIRAGKPTAAG